MSAQQRTGGGLVEHSANARHLAGAPPPPPSACPPLRRDNVTQPPALTTSLSGVQYQSGRSADYSATPASVVWESNSFTSTSSPYTASPGGALRGTSPMDARLAGSFASSYNPQEWASVGGRSSPHQGAGQFRGPPSRHHGDEPTEPPPPPYSPREPQAHFSPLGLTLSPAETASVGTVPSVYNTPISAATTISVDIPSNARNVRPRPLSMHNGLESQNQPLHTSIPPPPGQSHRGSRSASRGNSERTQALHHGSTLTSRSRLSNNVAAQDSANENSQEEMDATSRPPSAKRAASAGAIGFNNSSSRASSHAGSRSPSIQGRWEPGMPLPPPPPGPPPNSNRSKSSNGVGDGYSRSALSNASEEQSRAPSEFGASVDPVPSMLEERRVNDTGRGAGQPSLRQSNLHIDTTNIQRLAHTGSRGMHDSTETSSSSFNVSAMSNRRVSGGLFRSPALRDPSAKGIRERRSESRHARETVSDQNPSEDLTGTRSESPIPANLALSGSGVRSVSMSGKSSALRSDEGSSMQSTPRTQSARAPKHYRHASPTPPISAAGEAYSPTVSKNFSPRIPPKALPTPPLQSSRPPSAQSILAVPLGQDRPISHLLHLPNDPNIAPPLSPSKPDTGLTKQKKHSPRESDEQFVRDAAERYRKVLARERAASNDAERLHIFAEFMISESSLRRGRYAEAWQSGAIDVKDVRRQLFTEPPSPRPHPQTDPAPPIEPPSPMTPVEYQGARPETTWWENYKPSLSPIASISHNDEMSSRGRTPSRWWESQTGSGSGGRGPKIERSTRESKYMGVPIQEARERESIRSPRDLPNLGAFVKETQSSPLNAPPLYGPNEYPPEKQGWHEDVADAPLIADHSPTPPPSASLTALDPRLDISLFVTLPPPYPRHHPAISNSHPELAKYRNHVRAVSDFSEVTTRQARYKTNMDALHHSASNKLDEDRKAFMANVKTQIDEGGISFAEAAEAEEAFKHQEVKAGKERAQSEFDEFQDVVFHPLRGLLSPRIQKTTSIIGELIESLGDEDRMSNPNQPQEEGDERPELLEILTQLKWLFECRENLHRELYVLESQQNKLYEAVVTQPYLAQSEADAKLQSTRSFFKRDECERRHTFEQSALTRYEELERVIQQYVTKGVEVHLSAFWDIAPGLLDLVAKLPVDGQYLTSGGTGHGKSIASGFCGIQVPPKEIEENPAYGQFPEQYLWSLLTHAERSTYQFIESQVNLLCLQHEVHCGILASRCKTEEAVIALNHAEVGGSDRRCLARMNDARETREEEEKVLTDELQERVATVENLWRESLGNQLDEVKEGLKSWLIKGGGWEDDMNE
ncbi:MAG: hypothetical protein Q9227_008262 [Pyrenula ochraceoflavens]